MNAMKSINVTPVLLVSTGSGVTSAPVWEVISEMVDCVKTLMSVRHPTSALLPLPASTLEAHISVTVAVASSSITPSAMTRMSVWKAAAAPSQPAQIHPAPSPVSVQKGTGETASLVWMWMSVCWLSSATLMPFALTFLALITAPVRWVILEMG